MGAASGARSGQGGRSTWRARSRSGRKGPEVHGAEVGRRPLQLGLLVNQMILFGGEGVICHGFVMGKMVCGVPLSTKKSDILGEIVDMFQIFPNMNPLLQV